MKHFSLNLAVDRFVVISILFIGTLDLGKVVLIDASNLGEKIKNQKTVLTVAEEQRIIDVFNGKQQQEDFSVVISYRDIAAKNYSLSVGRYFDVKIEYVDITPEQFAEKMQSFNDNLESLFSRSRKNAHTPARFEYDYPLRVRRW